MSIYQVTPNLVKIVITDETGEAERTVVAASLDEVIARIELAFGSTPQEPVKKPRKKRRAKTITLLDTAIKYENARLAQTGAATAPVVRHRRKRQEPVTAGELSNGGESAWPK